jgi:uncharacterized oxidoreductase
MKTTNNTVLVTGGSAGIGLEIAKAFSELGNKVIITGRNRNSLEDAASSLTNVTALVSDITNPADVDNLVHTLSANHPDLNIIVNNAGAAIKYDLAIDEGTFEKAEQEMLTNYLSVIRLNEKLLPLLKTQSQSAIINVSSVVAFVPGVLATYSASKAALHSYTQSLRIALQNTPVCVFELMPPLVNTRFSAPIGGANGISPSEVAEQLLQGLAEDNFEIRVGQTEALYQLFLSSPPEALAYMHGRRK